MDRAVPGTLTPRFPHVAARAGHYESTYLTASHPTEPVAVWIRYTVHQAPGRPPTGSIWFTLFEPGGPTAVKVTDGSPRTADDDAAQPLLLAVGQHGDVRPDGASGSIVGHDVTASWQLRFEPTEDELQHLPHAWMYGAPVPRTKSTSPFPAMRVSGTVTVAGRTLTLADWSGMLGHNWGAEHAHRWVWLRGALFDDAPDAWLDVVLGRIKVGPVVLPWIANGVFAPAGPGGRRYRVSGLGHRATVRERSDGCDLVLPGRDVSLTVHVAASLAASVGWQYADPSGGRHQVRNCSVAEVTVDVRYRNSPTQRLHTTHGGVYELGTAEFDPAVVMQPYPDG